MHPLLAAGKRDRRVDLRRQLAGKDAAGQRASQWLTVETVWASVKPATGREVMNALAADAEIPTTFRILWRDDVDPSWVIAFEGKIFDLISINELGRREGLEILGVAKVKPA